MDFYAYILYDINIFGDFARLSRNGDDLLEDSTKKKLSNRIRIVLFVFFFLCTMSSGYFIWTTYRDAKRAEQLNSSLASQIQVSLPASSSESQLPYDDETPPYPVDFSKNSSGILNKYVALKDKYKNFAGWITVPETKYIDMPVMQATDNEYYLKHGIDDKYNWYGAIFMDAGNNPTALGRNTFVYGHNMGDGKVFGALTNYKKQDFAQKVPSFYFATATDEYDCIVFSAYNVYPDNWRLYAINFTDDADFMDYVNTAIKKSAINFGVTVTPQDKIISLSTCDYVFKDARMLVHAVLRKR